jgi:hypothetical protein
LPDRQHIRYKSTETRRIVPAGFFVSARLSGSRARRPFPASFPRHKAGLHFFIATYWCVYVNDSFINCVTARFHFAGRGRIPSSVFSSIRQRTNKSGLFVLNPLREAQLPILVQRKPVIKARQ